MTSRCRFALSGLIFCAVLATTTPARAQCDDWITTPGYHAPFRGSALDALAIYTPPGATVARVVVGGNLTMYQGTDLNHIAQWNGSSWLPMGSGMDSNVYDLVVWNSPTGQVLVAGGLFRHAGGLQVNRLAAWNGSAWSAIGGGVVDSIGGGWIRAVTVWDPDGSGSQPPNLVVAGSFSRAGTVEAQNIARWDGTTWRPFGIGLNSWVNALTVWDPDGSGPAFPHLIAAGLFDTANNTIVNGIARWDGAGWRRLGDGLDTDDHGFRAYPEALTTWDPDGIGPQSARLVVVGDFSSASGVEAHGIASWNGTTWQGFGTHEWADFSAVSTWDPDGIGPTPTRLIVSGRNFDANGVELPTPAMWNGTTFDPLGTFAFTRWAYKFATWDPDGAGSQPIRLVMSGLIWENLPTGAGLGVMQLVGNEWTNFGTSPQVFAAAAYSNRVVVGGVFEMLAADPNNANGTIDAWNLAAWDGAEVRSLGSISGTVRALKSYSTGSGVLRADNLTVAGTFGGAGGIMVNNIANYYERPQVINGSGWNAMGQGFNCSVHALERFNSATYAGGCFTMSGTTSVNRVARFDGTNWQPLGTGITNGTVRALCSYNGSLYAGGDFTVAGGITTGGLARWNGSAWSAVGGTFSGTVLALTVYNNQLIIGGQFGTSIPNIVLYNGTSFSGLGAGGANGAVRALTVGSDGLLYVGGDFTSVLGVAADRIARWNGSSWSAVRGGLNAPVHALATYRNEIHAGGTFGKARNAQATAPGWARYTVDGIPWIARQPSGSFSCSNDQINLTMRVPSGYFPLTAQWRHNGVPFSTGLRPWGSNVTLAYYGGLRIENARGADSGVYQCTVTHEGCGSVTSTQYHINICVADVDDGTGTGRCDGGVTIDDLLYYLVVFDQGLVAADVDDGTGTGTPEGGVTIDDLLYFLSRFDTGC